MNEQIYSSAERVVKLEIPLPQGRTCLIHIITGEPSHEEIQTIKRHLDLMDVTLNGRQPVEAAVAREKYKHRTAVSDLGDCSIHNIPRHPRTNQCPACSKERLSAGRDRKIALEGTYNKKVTPEMTRIIVERFRRDGAPALAEQLGIHKNTVRRIYHEAMKDHETMMQITG